MNYQLFTKKVGIELGAILGLSLTLGAVFNSSNPIGIHWSTAQQTAAEARVIYSAPENPPMVNPTLAATPSASAAHSGETTRSSSHDFAPITWKQVKPMLAAQQIVLVDARPKGTHESYNIPGSISLPFDSAAEELAAFRNRYATDSHLVIYCASETCLASQMLAEKLAPLGFQRIHIMQEGYFGWLRAEKGRDTVILSSSANEKASSEGESVKKESILQPPQPKHDAGDKVSESLPNVKASKAESFPAPISWVEAKPLVNAGKVILVDVRSESSYAAGHIPGAINLPEIHFAQQIAAFQKKYSSSSALVLYCASGTCSVSKRVADKLVKDYGYQSVHYMSGGYQEWQQWELSGTTPKH